MSSATTARPMNPDAPVTKTCMVDSLPLLMSVADISQHSHDVSRCHHLDSGYDPDMARWAPGASDRLQRAAMELFAEDGFEATTVAGIAGRAGVTERTFFRHFADKREVLFAGGEQL